VNASTRSLVTASPAQAFSGLTDIVVAGQHAKRCLDAGEKVTGGLPNLAVVGVEDRDVATVHDERGVDLIVPQRTRLGLRRNAREPMGLAAATLPPLSRSRRPTYVDRGWTAARLEGQIIRSSSAVDARLFCTVPE
jgi:hypothetical protein